MKEIRAHNYVTRLISSVGHENNIRVWWQTFNELVPSVAIRTNAP